MDNYLLISIIRFMLRQMDEWMSGASMMESGVAGARRSSTTAESRGRMSECVSVCT